MSMRDSTSHWLFSIFLNFTKARQSTISTNQYTKSSFKMSLMLKNLWKAPRFNSQRFSLNLWLTFWSSRTWKNKRPISCLSLTQLMRITKMWSINTLNYCSLIRTKKSSAWPSSLHLTLSSNLKILKSMISVSKQLSTIAQHSKSTS